MTRIKTDEIIEQSPIVTYCLDHNYKFLFLNRKTAEMAGISRQDSLVGKTYGDMNCDASEMHDNFCREDQRVLDTNTTIRSIGIAVYGDGQHHIMFGSKSPYKHNGQVGVLSNYQDVTNLGIFNLGCLLEAAQQNQLKQSGQVTLELRSFEPEGISLSQRENEILYHLLRGKTANEIANKIYRSKRTVESHLENIKYKMNCSTKSSLIEKSLDLGYLNYLPPLLLSHQNNTN